MQDINFFSKMIETFAVRVSVSLDPRTGRKLSPFMQKWHAQMFSLAYVVILSPLSVGMSCGMSILWHTLSSSYRRSPYVLSLPWKASVPEKITRSIHFISFHMCLRGDRILFDWLTTVNPQIKKPMPILASSSTRWSEQKVKGKLLPAVPGAHCLMGNKRRQHWRIWWWEKLFNHLLLRSSLSRNR